MNTSVRSGVRIAVAAEDVRQALDAIVVSPAFQTSPQLAAFLRFVVEAALSGQSDRIKGYTIAVEALGRNDKFDPQTDPIVRVEAGRLRRALDRYYAGPGGRDPVIIELPRGSYVPTFRPRGDDPHLPRMSALAAVVRQLPSRSSLAAIMLGVLGYAAVDLLIVDRFFYGNRDAPPTVARPVANALDGERRLHVGPSIFISPVSISPVLANGRARTASVLPTMLEDRLRDVFARFDDIAVISAPPNTATLPGSPRADYRLATSLDYRDDGALSASFQLVDETDGGIVWTRVFDGLDGDLDPRGPQFKVVREVAAALLQPFGIVHARERIKRATRRDRDPRYACLLESFDYFRNYDHAQHARVRGCLEDTTRHDPTFAAGFSSLARVYFREFLFDLSSDPARSLEHGLELARHAVDLSPNNVRAHYVLLDIHMARGEIAEAMAAGARVLALNPYDSQAVFHYAAQLVLLGETERGLKIITDYVRPSGTTPARWLFVQSYAAYLKSDFATAAAYANQITNERFPLAYVMQAVTRLNSGDRQGARLAASRLAARFPSWQGDLRRELKKYIPLPWAIDRIESDLRDAGLGDIVASVPATPPPRTAAPRVLIDRVEAGNPAQKHVHEADAIRDRLVSAFRRFDDVDIVVAGEAAPPDSRRAADYRFTITLGDDKDGGKVLLRLIDGDDGLVLWAKDYDAAQLQEHRDLPLVGEVAATLLHPVGVIATRERLRVSNRPGFDRYRCVLEATDYLRSFVPSRHAKARACLEEAVAADPTYASGYAALARVYLREHQFSANARPGDTPALERAAAAARRAVELNPDSARAQFVMFEVRAASGDIDGMRNHGQRAITLNPFDQSVVFHYGAQLIMIGEVEAGTALVQRVAAAAAVPPARLDFALFVASYLKGDMAEASRYAKRIANDAFVPGHLARALAAYHTEGAEATRRAVDRLAAVDPNWRVDPRGELAKFIPSKTLVERFARDLAAAGLGPQQKASRTGAAVQ